jgi:hypothetical protein
VFWAGDFHLIDTAPYFNIGEKKCLVEYEEYLQAMTLVKEGDIGLSTHKGFIFSNSAIPGLFKHALIFVKGPVHSPAGNFSDTTNMRIVEAISAGVVEHHPLHTRTDYMIILRPKCVTDEEIEKAVRIARKVVGSDYDTNFKFDIEQELKFLHEQKTRAFDHRQILQLQEDAAELNIHAQNLAAEFDHAFSCTETVATAWWHKRHGLDIIRRNKCGRRIIVSDQFINDGFEIVWLSKSVTPNMIKKLPSKTQKIIEAYWVMNKSI